MKIKEIKFKNGKVVKGKLTRTNVVSNPKENLVHITAMSDNGKLEGFVSISCNRETNNFCQAMRKNPPICTNNYACICEKCYASKTRMTLRKALMRNSEILKKRVLSDKELPKFKPDKVPCGVRLSAFDELDNVNQIINYLNICRLNEDVKFVLFTKNIALLDKVLFKYGKPANLTVVQSSWFINKVDKVNSEYVDKTFTVYSEEYIKEHNVEINCGGRKCKDCLRCYDNDKCKELREKLK